MYRDILFLSYIYNIQEILAKSNSCFRPPSASKVIRHQPFQLRSIEFVVSKTANFEILIIYPSTNIQLGMQTNTIYTLFSQLFNDTHWNVCTVFWQAGVSFYLIPLHEDKARIQVKVKTTSNKLDHTGVSQNRSHFSMQYTYDSC